MSILRNAHPPSVPLVVRVGVTGHRLKYLNDVGFNEALLRASIRSVLVRLRTTTAAIHFQNCFAYKEVGPTFRIISPLAEGSDRLVAEEALAMGFQLQSPIPFPLDDYKEDFDAEASKANFDRLFRKSQRRLELDGSRDSKDIAYEETGRIVLRQSDLLIAIWNGEAPQGRGGTGQIVKEALTRKMPVVLISPLPPHKISFLEKISEEGQAALTKDLDTEVDAEAAKRRASLGMPSQTNILSARLEEILALPSNKEVQSLRRFLGEKQHFLCSAVWYKLFCKAFAWTEWKFPRIIIHNFEERCDKNWLTPYGNLREPNKSAGELIDKTFRRPFNWSDGISEIHSDRHRSSFVITYLSGAFAVLAAFLGSHSDDLPNWFNFFPDPHLWFKIELALIFNILLLVGLNNWGHWQQRWVDYRLLAEGLRQARALSPFARLAPSFEVPAHLSDDDHGPTWFNWYFRALVRESGLVTATVDQDYINACRNTLEEEIDDQIVYHSKNQTKLHALHHRLDKLSLGLFFLTLLACILHLAEPLKTALSHNKLEGIVTLGAIVFPAFGAAIQGILHQGEFERMSRRSRSIKDKLNILKLTLERDKTISFLDLGRMTESFCEIQLMEQADWRSVFKDQKISL